MPFRDPEAGKAYRRSYYQANRERKNAYSKAWKQANPERVKTSRQTCAERKRATDKAYRERNQERLNEGKKAWYQANAERIKARSRAYHHANAERIKGRSTAYWRANAERLKAQQKAYLKTNPNRRLAHYYRSRLLAKLKDQNARKSQKSVVFLGCDIPWLVAWIEIQLKPGMSWENYGPIWHVDHKRPCASFDLSDPAQQRLCFHWTNLQPLFAEENLSKGSKWEIPQEAA